MRGAPVCDTIQVKLRFYIDSGGQPHIHKHGVTEDEVGEAFQNIFEDRLGRESSRIVIAKTEAGRILKVIYSPESKEEAFVISARELAGTQLTAFRRRIKKRYGKK